MKLLNFFLFPILIFLLTASVSTANEIVLFGGPLNHTAVGGCCLSSGQKTGMGALGRIDFGDNLNELDLSVFSDGRWSEGLVLKPFHLWGAPPRFDTGAGDQVQAKSVSTWRWVSSLGAGFFTHTTKAKTTETPTLVTGLVFSNINQFYYSLNDKWSATALIQFSFAKSRSDESYLLGTFFGAAYDF